MRSRHKMINLIYAAFPYGSSEQFVEYEIPFVNQMAGKDYRIFSFYRGNGEKRDIHLTGELYSIKPRAKDYLFGICTLTPKELLGEIKAIRKRTCPDSIIRCLWRLAYYRAYGYALYRNTKGIQFAEGEVFSSYWLTECAYAAVLLKKWHPSIRVVSRGHGYDVYDQRCYLPFRKTIFEKLDRVYTVNETERSYILDKYKWIPSDKLETAHLGINLPQGYSKQICRKPFRIITCSSVIQLKRLDLLICALQGIKDIEFEWYHIGGGPLFEQITTMASEILTEKNQKFSFLGQMPLSEVHKYYQQHDLSVFINCSDTEGIPVSIMEAMSYGIPVIARNIGGNSEIVGNDTGLLLNSDENPHEIEEAIRYVFSMNDEDYYQLRENARKKIENSFNAEKQYTEYFSALQKMN